MPHFLNKKVRNIHAVVTKYLDLMGYKEPRVQVLVAINNEPLAIVVLTGIPSYIGEKMEQLKILQETKHKFRFR